MLRILQFTSLESIINIVAIPINFIFIYSNYTERRR